MVRKMNPLTIYSWDDAPHALREACISMIPKGFKPIWLGHVTQSGKWPSLLMACATKGWLDMGQDGLRSVFHQFVGDGEVRVGVVKSSE